MDYMLSIGETRLGNDGTMRFNGDGIAMAVFVPIGDIIGLFDHLVGEGKRRTPCLDADSPF
jgi:hypothetical protein